MILFFLNPRLCSESTFSAKAGANVRVADSKQVQSSVMRTWAKLGPMINTTWVYNERKNHTKLLNYFSFFFIPPPPPLTWGWDPLSTSVRDWSPRKQRVNALSRLIFNLVIHVSGLRCEPLLWDGRTGRRSPLHNYLHPFPIWSSLSVLCWPWTRPWGVASPLKDTRDSPTWPTVSRNSTQPTTMLCCFHVPSSIDCHSFHVPIKEHWNSIQFSLVPIHRKMSWD